MKMTGALEVTTPSDREIMMTRVFNAPRALIFDAFTRPELLKRWLFGPPGWSLVVCEVDLRVGGTFRYVWRGPDGEEMGMRSICREIVAPERLVAAERFDQPWYTGEAINTMILVEQDGRTTLTQTVLYESREARDTALRSGMEQRLAMGYDRLAELLAPRPATGTARLDPAVDAFMFGLDHPLKQEIEAVRRIILGSGPGIGEAIKWKSPSFRTTEFFATVNLRSTDRLQLVFHTGAKVKAQPKEMEIPDPSGLITWITADRCLVTLGAGSDIQAGGAALEAIVREWITYV